jgi:hypothetical protein
VAARFEVDEERAADSMLFRRVENGWQIAPFIWTTDK